MNVSLGAVATNLGLLAVLLAAKIVPKAAFVYPLASRADRRHGTFRTLLMSTGLTFGTISSLYGLNAGIIDKTQFSLLVAVVVLSAVVPTAIAERWFLPDADRERRIDRRLAAIRARSTCEVLAIEALVERHRSCPGS
jgi:Kef-type K+ transport system membrane component KefB